MIRKKIYIIDACFIMSALIIIVFYKDSLITSYNYILYNKLNDYEIWMYITVISIFFYRIIYKYILKLNNAKKFINFSEKKLKRLKLEKSEEFYRTLYNNSHLIMLVMDTEEGNIIDANQAACDFYGYTKNEFIKLRIDDINILSQEELLKKIKNAQLKRNSKFHFKHRLSNKEIKDVEIYSGVIEISKIEYVYSVVHDITEDIKNKENLKVFEKLLENNNEGIVITDDKGNITWTNKAFNIITGYKEDELIGKNPSLLKSGNHDSDFYKNMWECIIEEGSWKGEIWNSRKNGNIYLEEVSIFAIKDEFGYTTNFAGIIRDITENKCKEEKINYLAFRDSLTGLYNRAFFIEELNTKLDEATKNKENLAIIFMDLDGFKKVNDNLGHTVGDKLLQEVSKRLKETIRKNDTVARIGGDEFIILLPKVKREKCPMEVAERVIDMFKEPYKIDEYDIYISVSIGIAIYPDDGLNSDTLIKNADIAMYNAKDNGKSKFELYSSNLNEKIKEEFELENSLRDAFENDEFFIEYQPIVNMDRYIVGVEALLRWKNSKIGIVSPDKFIPIAEKNSFIISIGEWVIRNACMQAKKWHDKGYRIFISVNISVSQLKEKDFVDMVSQILYEVGLENEYLELEITESISMENIDYIINVLNKLKELKVTISMDDFGTGYSSLAQLKNLYITKLKIDKSFTKDIDIDLSSTSIVSTIIAMAKSLNLKVVAEGVETESQLEFLKKYGCDMVQGYLISRPIDSESFEKLMKI